MFVTDFTCRNIKQYFTETENLTLHWPNLTHATSKHCKIAEMNKLVLPNSQIPCKCHNTTVLLKFTILIITQ